MAEPNPILGVHVAPLATAWAQVRREPDLSFRVLAWGVEKTPEDAAEAVAEAAAISARRSFRGRGTFLALPDGSGCLVTAALPPEEADLAGEDLTRELHEYTPFEPGVAALRHRQVLIEGRRRELLVAALPAAQERRFAEAVARHDDGTIGLGFSGACLLRGVHALGLAPRPGFLVEMLARTTHVYALDERRVHRYLVAAGAEDVIAAAAAALGRDAAAVRSAVHGGTTDAATDAALAKASEDLAEDVQTFTRYHVAQQYAPKDPPEGLPPAQFAAAGPVLGAAPLRKALASHLGHAFAETAPKSSPAARVAWDGAPGDAIAAVAGAVGAALEAFAPAEDRLALRAPPREVEEVRSGGRWAVPAALVLVLAGAGGAWWWSTQGEGPPRTDGRPNPPLRTTTTSARPAERATAAPVDDAARAVALLLAADSIADVTDGLFDVSGARLEWSGEGYRVTLRVAGPASARPPAIARLAPGVEGESWTAAGSATPDTTTYDVRWFVRRPPVPELGSLGTDAAPRLGAALDAWRAARTSRTRSLGGTLSAAPGGARIVEVPGGSVAGAVALADAADVIDAAARRSQDRGSWLDTSVVCGPADVVATVRSGRGEAEMRFAGAPAAGPAAPAAPAADAASFADAVEAALRAPAPRTADRWSRDLALGTGPDADGARLRWPAGPPRTLQRRDPGDAGWMDAGDVPSEAGDRAVPAADLPAARRWRLVESGPATARAGVSVEVLPTRSARPEALAKRDGSEQVRVRLTRNAPDGAAQSVEEWFSPGDPLRMRVGASRLVLDAECRLRRARVREETEPVRNRVPRFLPDGRVERGPDGAPVEGARESRRTVRWLDVEFEDASGAVRSDSRKMTDG